MMVLRAHEGLLIVESVAGLCIHLNASIDTGNLESVTGYSPPPP